MEHTIRCPSCRSEFELTSLMRSELEAEVRATVAEEHAKRAAVVRAAADARVAEAATALTEARAELDAAHDREANLMKQQRELADREGRLELDLQRRLSDETARIREEESKAAAARFSGEANDRLRAKDREMVEMQGKLAAATTKEAGLLRKERELAEKEQRLGLELEQRLRGETIRIRQEEAARVGERLAREADDRVRVKEHELEETQAKLTAAAAREADLLRKQRELADREQYLAVETERRVANEVANVREHDRKLAEQRSEHEAAQQRLRDEEQRRNTCAMQKTISDLTRKLQQGSQQAQGEAQEVVLRDMLSLAFPLDAIEDVPPGAQGADLVQVVHGADGTDCGRIVWESKRTRTWSDEWLPKLRDDQRQAGGACAVIVTQVLPPGVRHFGLKDDVWVCAPTFAAPLGAALRGGIIDVHLAKRAAEGSGQKMQLVYDYLVGTEFRNRVGGMIEAFVEMQEEFAREKRATMMGWHRREKTMGRALDNITALCGDLQGIAGRRLGDLLPAALDSARALPEAGSDDVGGIAGPDGGSEGPHDAKLREILLDLLPADGSSMGNGSMSDLFIARASAELNVRLMVNDYERCKERLVAEGRIRRGKGRGGSVGRVVASAAE